MDDMAVVGHPTALSSSSFSGKGTDNGLGASSGSMSQPLNNLDLLCIHLALIFVLSKIILVMASPSYVSMALVDVVTGGVLSIWCDDFHNLILPYLPIFVPSDAGMFHTFHL